MEMRGWKDRIENIQFLCQDTKETLILQVTGLDLILI